jgi:hypothetical protein
MIEHDIRQSATSARSVPRREYRHRDVSGGWLRRRSSGATDGLVTNASLILGAGGADLSPHPIVLTGPAPATATIATTVGRR